MPSKTVTAIGALCILESVAMITNHDGAFLLPVVAVIAGLAGYRFGKYRKCGEE